MSRSSAAERMGPDAAVIPAPGQPQPAIADPALATQLAQLDLRDIQPAAAPPVWPPAPGWWLLAALLLVLAGAAFQRGWRLWRRARRRRRVLAELDGLRGRPCGARLIGEVSALLKRAALSRFPRAQVAPLTGTEWLDFLDRTGGGGEFTRGAGRVLADGPYAPAPRCDTDALLASARNWLSRNL